MSDPASSLRHDLRTATAHIIGYSDLLIEAAEDGGRPDLLDGFRELRDLGRRSLAAVKREPSPPSAEEHAPVSDVLRSELERLVEGIAAACTGLLGRIDGAAPPVFAADLERVRVATARLIVLAGRTPRDGGPAG